MLGKLSSLASDAVAAGKEKLAAGTDNAVRQFLDELRALQPILDRANIRTGGYRIVISVPPRFEILSDPSMDWSTVRLDPSLFEGMTLTKYQEMIVSVFRQAASMSAEIKARGFVVTRIDFELGIPPVVTIEIKPIVL